MSCQSQTAEKKVSIAQKSTKATDSPVELLNANTFHEQVMGKEVQLIDIRTPQEFVKGHIDDAININFYAPSFVAQMEKSLDKSRPIYIYCRSGNRTGQASRILSRKGFVKVYDLQGGIGTWARAGLPFVK
jgi:rhodanese-related sulfurtransferase